MRRLIVCLAVAALATVFGVSSASAGEGDLEQWCKTEVKLDQVDAPTEKLLQKFRDTAPPEIAEQVDQGVTQFEEQGEDAFEDEAFVALITEIDQFAVDNCGYEVVDVVMGDYSFTGIPAEIEKGTVAFNLTNEGAELHEIAFLRLKGDATLDDVVAAEEDEFDELATEVKGAGFAFPGASDVAFITFKKPGNYVALCHIPVGTTPESVEAEEGGGEEHEEGGEEAPPHYTEGMAAEFEVT